MMTARLPSASELSHSVDHQVLALVIISSFLITLVFSLMIFFGIKYRKHSTADRSNPQTQSKPLEFTLIGLIFIFGFTTFCVSAKTFFAMVSPPDQAREIFIVAKQWLWIFHEPGHQDSINEITVEKDVPVKFTMISEDVIHSFFIPAFRLKQDVLPGKYTSTWVTPTETGDFSILCTQYCGLSHSEMRAVIHVVAQNSISEKTAVAPPIRTGQKLLHEKGCLSCHADSKIGPSLARIFGNKVVLADGRTVTIDDEYLRRSLFDPNAEVVKGYAPVMPSFLGLLSESDVRAIITEIKSGDLNNE